MLLKMQDKTPGGNIKKFPKLSQIAGYTLIASFLLLCLCLDGFWPSLGFYATIGIAVLFGFSIAPCLLKPIDKPKTTSVSAKTQTLQCGFGFLYLFLLVSLSGSLVLFSLITQSQFSPKMTTLSFFPFYELLKTQGVRLFLPWFILSSVAVLTQFYAQKNQKTAWLPDLTFLNPKKHPQQFLHRTYHDLLHIGIVAGGIILLICALGLTNQGLTQVLNVHSAWASPIRNTLFIFGVVVFSYRKRHDFLKKYTQRGFSLGTLFFIYFLTLSAGLLLFEGFMRLAVAPINEQDFFQNQGRLLAAMDNRAFIEGLFTYWPLLFMPFINPFLCRFTAGLKVWQAWLYPLILPAILYLGILPNALHFTGFLKFITLIQHPAYLISFGLLLACFLFLLYQHVHNQYDLHFGKLPVTNLVYKNHPLFLFAVPLFRNLFYWLPFTLISGWQFIKIVVFSLDMALWSALGISALVVFSRCLTGKMENRKLIDAESIF